MLTRSYYSKLLYINLYFLPIISQYRIYYYSGVLTLLYLFSTQEYSVGDCLVDMDYARSSKMEVPEVQTLSTPIPSFASGILLQTYGCRQFVRLSTNFKLRITYSQVVLLIPSMVLFIFFSCPSLFS